jgi:hypothetical protein
LSEVKEPQDLHAETGGDVCIREEKISVSALPIFSKPHTLNKGKVAVYLGKYLERIFRA